MKGGKSGQPAVVAGNSSASELVRRLETADPDEVMPPPRFKKPLSPDQVSTLRHWIDAGAAWGKHWAFEKPVRPALPFVQDTGWVRSDLDRFVLAGIESARLKPSPEARRETLIRRATLDLTGLPPTAEEVDLFLADSAPGAFERLVDRLLASRRYGERMAWDWLEAARYADSNGYQGDSERTMWPWRDWVVEAFNRNLPYDEFTVWQLAGDLLPNPTLEQRIATGFCRNHMINGEGGRIPEENRIDYVMDMTETMGTVWLGLTLNCSRCHDHKYDPVAQKDYYRLAAGFNQTPVTGGDGSPQAAPNVEVPSEAQTRERVSLDTRFAGAATLIASFEDRKFPRPNNQPVRDWPEAVELPKEIQDSLGVPPAKRDRASLDKLATYWKDYDPDHARLLLDARGIRDQQNRLNGSIPRVMVMEDRKEVRDTFVLTRGIYDKPNDKVVFGTPASLPPIPAGEPMNRLGLARWLVSTENPLTARVVVNRFWSQFFGAGLVKTPEDFGIQGEKPSNPELLDWLATEFMKSGWDVKHLCRVIVTSATYRQSSAADAAAIERDPQNRLLARGPRFRMPSWMLRDQALAVSGLLVDRTGGAPVNPYQPAGVWEEATFGGKRYSQDHGEGLYRRSLYTFWRRIVGPTVFFDTTPRQVCNVKPPRTNTPLHALTTLNDVTYIEAARSLARWLLHHAATPAERVELAYRKLLGRKPTAAERDVLVRAAARYATRFGADPAAARELLSTGESQQDAALAPEEHAAYTLVCSTLLNLDEALTKE